LLSVGHANRADGQTQREKTHSIGRSKDNAEIILTQALLSGKPKKTQSHPRAFAKHPQCAQARVLFCLLRGKTCDMIILCEIFSTEDNRRAGR
jgi:hypothetical protein